MGIYLVNIIKERPLTQKLMYAEGISESNFFHWADVRRGPKWILNVMFVALIVEGKLESYSEKHLDAVL